MALKIEEQLGRKQGKGITFKATGYNPETKELHIFVEKIEDERWHRYLDEGKDYIFEHHPNSDDTEPDPMEIWELPTNQKKWKEQDRIAILEYDLVFPQILLYFWHNDSRLSMEWDW